MREHWKDFQPGWYQALIRSRKLQRTLQGAAERMYRELTEPKGSANEVSGPMTVDRWRRMKLEKELEQANSEIRRAAQLQHDKPKVNIFGYTPLVDPAGLSAGEMRIPKMAGAILVMVTLGLVVFLALRL